MIFTFYVRSIFFLLWVALKTVPPHNLSISINRARFRFYLIARDKQQTAIIPRNCTILFTTRQLRESSMPLSISALQWKPPRRSVHPYPHLRGWDRLSALLPNRNPHARHAPVILSEDFATSPMARWFASATDYLPSDPLTESIPQVW